MYSSSSAMYKNWWHSYFSSCTYRLQPVDISLKKGIKYIRILMIWILFFYQPFCLKLCRFILTCNLFINHFLVVFGIINVTLTKYIFFYYFYFLSLENRESALGQDYNKICLRLIFAACTRCVCRCESNMRDKESKNILFCSPYEFNTTN